MNSAIFEGQVRHHRMTPVPHAFRYHLFMMYLDLDELESVFDGRWLWSVRRWALARFRRRDHFGDPSEPLATSVRRHIQKETGRWPEGPIRLLTHLRYFGYCFNPVSFFYCYDRDDKQLETIVAEVNNTPWGERHVYVLSEQCCPDLDFSKEFTTNKAMHVSPFMSMDVQYRWKFTTRRDRLIVHMETAKDGDKIFDASLSLERTEISGPSLARVLAFHPLMTIKVIAAIHWQALRLWLKGAPVHEHKPKPTELMEKSS
jgi:DUF1365 family protein